MHDYNSGGTFRRACRLTAALVAVSVSGGCGQGSPTKLPDIAPIGRPLMTPSEQRKAINELEARKVRSAVEAVKEIEARK